MQPSSTVPDADLLVERRATFRTAFVDGRQARLVVHDGFLSVRILDESVGGYRVVAGDACALPERSQTILQLDEREMPVRIIYKRLEGARTMLGLQRLPT